MLTEEEWARIKAKWIAEGRIPDDNGYYHYTREEELEDNNG